jgi:hypothetical protein
MNGFDPSKLSGRGSSPRAASVRSERVFMAVDHYETPSDGFHFAVGSRLDTGGETVRVRLNTVQERAADRPKDNAEKIKSQYVTGENHRDTLAEKDKAGVPYLSFDDAREIGSQDGVTEFRAHWPKTISTDPKAEILIGMGHIRLRDAVEGPEARKAQAYVELLRGSAMASRENIDEVLTRSLSIQDEQGRARDPLVIMRVMYEGVQRDAPRIYPKTEKVPLFDQGTGETKEYFRNLDAPATIGYVMSGEAGRNDFETLQLDKTRAIVAGLKDLELPLLASTDPDTRDAIANLYHGVKLGKLQIEIIAADKIDFGADSRKTYLADKQKDRGHLAAYDIRLEGNDREIRQYAGYTDTVVAMLRHTDGEPYAVFASPAEMYPTTTKLVDLPLRTAPEIALTSGRAYPDRSPTEPADSLDGPAAQAEEGLEEREEEVSYGY